MEFQTNNKSSLRICPMQYFAYNYIKESFVVYLKVQIYWGPGLFLLLFWCPVLLFAKSGNSSLKASCFHHMENINLNDEQ